MADARENSGPDLDPASSPPDSKLGQRIKRSDHHAFKLLYYRYYEALYGFIWRRVRDDNAARELTQTLFVRVWQGRARLDPRQALKAYLYRVAANLVVDHFRALGRANLTSLDAAAGEPVAGPDDSFELEEMLEQAVRDLPEALRTVFRLSRVDGLKYSQIAERLEISVKTVESRMGKAFGILRQRLKPFVEG